MKLVTWNVNSIRQRLPRLLAMLGRHEPDIVFLQETKVEDTEFPTMEIGAAGYEFATLGQRGYNGVAILSKVGLDNIRTGFEGDPVPEQSRVLAVRAGDMDAVCVYVVNGKAVGDPAYETKLAWLDALRAWLTSTYDPAYRSSSPGISTSRRTTATSGIPCCGRGRTSRATRSANGWGPSSTGGSSISAARTRAT